MTVTNAQNSYAYLDRDVHQGIYWGQQKNAAPAEGQGDELSASAGAKADSAGFFGADGFGFDDFLDIINPLQHIPVISTLYREFTGDNIETGARVIGGGIFGGGIGLAAAFVNAAVETETGKDIGGHVMAMVSAVTGGEDNAEVAVGEAVTISWNSDRQYATNPASSQAEGKPIAPLTVAGPEKVIDDATLLQLAAQNNQANPFGLQLKPGFTSNLPSASAAPAAPATSHDKGTAAYEKISALKPPVPAAPVQIALNDFAYLEDSYDR